MFMPFIYRLIGYQPIKDDRRTDRAVNGAAVEIRAAVVAFRDDVTKLMAAVQEAKSHS